MKHSNMQFIISPGVGTVETYTQRLAWLTGQVKQKDEGERRGSVAERPAKMSAPRLKTTREKSWSYGGADRLGEWKELISLVVFVKAEQ